MILKWVLLITVCIFYFWKSWMSFYKSSNVNIHENSISMDQVVADWKKDLITEIKFSSTGNCPSGFDLAYAGNWHGTEIGCNCIPAPNCIVGLNLTDLSLGRCSLFLLQCGCTDVQPILSKRLILTPTHESICVKKPPNLNFHLLHNKTESNENCVSGYKRCNGSNQNYMSFCIPDAELCPIRDIVFAASNPDAAKYTEEELTTSGINVYFNRIGSSAPLVSTALLETKPCQN